MSEAQEKIKWGDILRLHGVSTVPGREMKGLIISKGYTPPHLDSLTPISTTKPIITTTKSTSTGNHFSKSSPKATLTFMTSSSSMKGLRNKKSQPSGRDAKTNRNSSTTTWRANTLTKSIPILST